MQIYSDVRLQSISVVVEKREDGNFCFRCPQRVGDGFVFVLSGNGSFTCSDGVFPLKQGDIMLVQKNDAYVTAAGKEGLSYITTLFEATPENAFRELGLPSYMETAAFPHIETAVRNLLALWEKRPNMYFMKSRILIEQLLADLTDIVSEPESNDRLVPAIAYITNHYSAAVTNEHLADLCGLSVTHFRRLFREKYGITPLQYREEIRTHWAIKLLESRMFTMTEIAERLGYSDVYHFSKSLKKHTGFSPSHYQKGAGGTPIQSV